MYTVPLFYICGPFERGASRLNNRPAVGIKKRKEERTFQTDRARALHYTHVIPLKSKGFQG